MMFNLVMRLTACVLAFRWQQESANISVMEMRANVGFPPGYTVEMLLACFCGQPRELGGVNSAVADAKARLNFHLSLRFIHDKEGLINENYGPFQQTPTILSHRLGSLA